MKQKLLISALLVLLFQSNYAQSTDASAKTEVLEKSHVIMPAWVDGWSRGKVYKQKKGNKNTTLEKGSMNYWFSNEYEFAIEYKEDNGATYHAPRQDAERLANAQAASKYAELISTDVKTAVSSSRRFDGTTSDRIAAISDNVQAEAKFSGFLPVGKAWKRILKNGKQYWVIYLWYSVTKDNFNKAVESVLTKAELKPEEKKEIIESIEKNKEEKSDDEDGKK